MKRTTAFVQPKTCRRGVTAVEVLIGLGLVALLASIATPLILSRRESSRRSQCATRMAAVTQAMLAYHDQHGSLPPAAVWDTHELQTLALHESKRWDLFIGQNWAILLLPYLGQQHAFDLGDSKFSIGSKQNAGLRSLGLDAMNCPSDEFNRTDNPYRYKPSNNIEVEFARGNFAINGGTNSFHTSEGTTSTPTGDHANLVMDDEHREFRYWGNGIAGFNQSFRLDEFRNGKSSLVAINEIRAGIHAVDPRGAWALGHIASSVTWGHGANGDAGGPNNLWARSDDIQGGGKLNEIFGPQELIRLGMPCVSYIDQNQNATSRSRHSSGVNTAFLDGAVRFVSDKIDQSLWHVMHSRETPEKILADAIPSRLNWPGSNQEAKLVKPAAQDTGSPSVSNVLEMTFALIPAGEFKMGLPDAGNNRDTPPESPVHRVIISAPFYLGATEVTQDQYRKVMDENPSWHQPPRVANEWSPDFPVENVTWDQATEFCRRLAELPEEKSAGRTYRLPTEAEWEYACRSGMTVPYSYSARIPSNGEAAGNRELPLTKVGSYPANSFGLYDMRGNVWEWCSDWFDRDYYSRSPIQDPAGPAEGYIKLVRGRDFIYAGEHCFINYPPIAPWKSSKVIGFRVVCMTAEPK